MVRTLLIIGSLLLLQSCAPLFYVGSYDDIKIYVEECDITTEFKIDPTNFK